MKKEIITVLKGIKTLRSQAKNITSDNIDVKSRIDALLTEAACETAALINDVMDSPDTETSLLHEAGLDDCVVSEEEMNAIDEQANVIEG